MMRRFSVFIVAVIAALGVSAGLAHLTKISRSDLGINDKVAERCAAPQLQPFWHMIGDYPDYAGEQVANYFGIFAAYASNVYTPKQTETFDLKPEYFGWRQRGDNIVRAGGFLAQVFYKETIDRLLVMTVYRGTDGVLSVEDNISNASWFTQMINPWDQYRTARETFQEVRSFATQVAAGRTVSYLTVGHSLGGGLARHIAKAFPCTSAVVFNSSFITNEFRLKEPYNPQIVDIFEDEDPLTRAALYVKPDQFFKNNAKHQWYRVRNLDESFANQHGIYDTARTMARIPLACLNGTGGCGGAISDTRNLPAGYNAIPYPRGLLEVGKLWCYGAQMNGKSDLCKDLPVEASVATH